jgi:NAD-dependent deacetylase
MTNATKPIDPMVRAGRALAQAQRIFVLTGAGISAESGISTFRDAQTGHWSRFDPMRLASQDGFGKEPGVVWRWYMERLAAVEQAEPNAGHRALAALAALVPHVTLATQNVDNLHERGGTPDVLHLHGSITAHRCNGCGRPYTLQECDRERDLPPECAHCGAYIRPAVVWFGELLPGPVLEAAYAAAERCHAMIVVGTSGMVYPAAGLPDIAKAHDATVIDVNVEPNPITEVAHIYLQGKGGNVLPRLVDEVKRQRTATEQP